MTSAPSAAARGLLRRLGWLAGDYAFAAWCQVRGAVGPRDPYRYADPPGRRSPDVLLVPGVLEPWPFLAPLAERLHRAGHAVHVVPGLGYHRQDLPDAARVVADLLVERDLRDVVLVGHSKGGLVGKLLLCDPDIEGRVRGVVAIATPFAGSRRARLVPLRTIQVFRPDAPGIVALGRDADADARIVSVFGSWDPHIPEGSELAGARNVRLATPGHFRVLSDPRLPHVVLDAVAALAR